MTRVVHVHKNLRQPRVRVRPVFKRLACAALRHKIGVTDYEVVGMIDPQISVRRFECSCGAVRINGRF